MKISKGAEFSHFTINSGRGKKPGGWPSPSSNHPGGFYAFFVDGRGIFLSEDIDPKIYVRLVSPAGVRYGQELVDEGAF